jgi:type III secretory pathway component EscR
LCKVNINGFVHKRLVGTLLGAVVVIGLIIMAALVALLIHSYSDGNLQIPANTLLFIAISGAGLRSFSLPRS